MEFCSASSKSQTIISKYCRVLCTRRSIAWNAKAGLPASGVSRKTSAKPSTTVSPPRESAGYKQRLKIGTAWRTSLRESCAQLLRKYNDVERCPVLATGFVSAVPHGRRNGCRTPFPRRIVQRGVGPQRRPSPGSPAPRPHRVRREIGRASCRERV